MACPKYNDNSKVTLEQYQAAVKTYDENMKLPQVSVGNATGKPAGTYVNADGSKLISVDNLPMKEQARITAEAHAPAVATGVAWDTMMRYNKQQQPYIEDSMRRNGFSYQQAAAIYGIGSYTGTNKDVATPESIANAKAAIAAQQSGSKYTPGDTIASYGTNTNNGKVTYNINGVQVSKDTYTTNAPKIQVATSYNDIPNQSWVRNPEPYPYPITKIPSTSSTTPAPTNPTTLIDHVLSNNTSSQIGNKCRGAKCSSNEPEPNWSAYPGVRVTPGISISKPTLNTNSPTIAATSPSVSKITDILAPRDYYMVKNIATQNSDKIKATSTVSVSGQDNTGKYFTALIQNPSLVRTDQYLPYISYSDNKTAANQMLSAGKSNLGTISSVTPINTKTRRKADQEVINGNKTVTYPFDGKQRLAVVGRYDKYGNLVPFYDEYGNVNPSEISTAARRQKSNRSKKYRTYKRVQPMNKAPMITPFTVGHKSPKGLKGFDGSPKGLRKFGTNINVNGYSKVIKVGPVHKDVRPVGSFQFKKNKVNTEHISQPRFGKTLLKRPVNLMFRF
jgi:hypothetical protein